MAVKQELRTNLATSFRSDGYWVPLPGPQTLAVALSKDKRYREILFGGARGPGKTDASIAILGDRFPDPRAKQWARDAHSLRNAAVIELRKRGFK